MTRIKLPPYDIVAIRAPNPGPFTLSGTNSWLVGRDPGWLIDPGPSLDAHLQALVDEAGARGGLGGIALTHDHPDHAQALREIRERFPQAAIAGARGEVDLVLSDGSVFGPLVAVAIPGHAPDHFGFLFDDVLFTGDAILGEGSSLITPYPGALRSYLEALEALRRRKLALLAPGHGPPVRDVQGKLEEYISHRLDRERRLLAALGTGRRAVNQLLDDVWNDAPAALRPAATATLAAHLDKLAEEGRLPRDVERPQVSLLAGEAGGPSVSS
jgi:glyoxylase-like metal-dependent hydrolase (beta-lactamase superfamily II)